MRVRVIRWPDPVSSVVNLRVERWCSGQWEPLVSYGLHESERANEVALQLSLTKRVPIEVAVFEDGEKLDRRMPFAAMYDQDGEKLESSP